MNITPRLQKFALLAHLTFSLGWLGAVVAYLALAIGGFSSHDAEMMRAAYLSMELIGWYVIVPFSFATLLSGLVQSLATRWGLFRHWWIVAKLLLTIFAIVILLLHMRDMSHVSRRAAETTMSSANFVPDLIHAGGGLLVLLAATTLSVFKPWGMTPWTRRQTSEASRADLPSRRWDDPGALGLPKPARELVFAASGPRWTRIIAIHALAIILLFTLLHVTGLHRH